MRCDNCPAQRFDGYEYPESFCEIGVSEDEMNESKDGELGCKLPRNKIIKMLTEEEHIYF